MGLPLKEIHMTGNKTLYIVCSVLVLAALKGVAGNSPLGMGVFFLAVFLLMKPLVGIRSWGHALLGGVVASILYIAYPRVVHTAPEREWQALLVISAVVLGGLAVALWQQRAKALKE